jgi:hypothetical protein
MTKGAERRQAREVRRVRRCWWRFVALIVVGTGIALGYVGAVQAQTCTGDDICACMGEAGYFDIVGSVVTVKAGKLSAEPVESYVESSVCATTGSFSGIADGETEIDADLICSSGPGTTAVKLKGYKDTGSPMPGVSIFGDLATGGGAIKGVAFAEVSGTVDTTGTYSEVASCKQAVTDMQTASSNLSKLRPTKSPAAISVEAGTGYVLSAVAGVNVINVTSIKLGSGKMTSSEFTPGGTLLINLADETESLILNVGQLLIGTGAIIAVEGGDPSMVIINVNGVKPKVKIGKGASVDPAILAPTVKLSVPVQATVANLYGAKIKIHGAQVLDALLCP